jgi:two-component system, NtrC family, response regulator AtoC
VRAVRALGLPSPGKPTTESLRDELERTREEVRVLRQVSSELNATLDLDAIYGVVLRTMDELFGFRHALILLTEDDGRMLRVAAARGYKLPCMGARIPVGTGVIGLAARQRKVLRVGNLSRHRAYAAAVRKQIEKSGAAAELDEVPTLPGLPRAETQIAIPLLSHDRLVGMFAVESEDVPTFGERDEELATIVGNLAAGALRHALLYRRVEERTEELGRELCEVRAQAGARPFGIDDIVGESRPMKAVKRLIRRVAASPSSTVLVTGENGTGKDLAAKVIHGTSRRAGGPFMNITCSALPEPLLESELFGHERGAFTDARQQKKGLLELADGGTVFLDEIGEMTLALQAKLLRFLEEKTFRRVGGAKDLRVDVRVVAATNRDLRRAVKEARFREDLFYRLQVLEVELPPLRQRTGDVALLAQSFLERYRVEFHRNVTGLTREAGERLEAHAWPGNVRELRNAVERAVLLADGPVLRAEDFAGLQSGDAREVPELPATGLVFDQLERDLVAQALERTAWNKAAAAALLGVNRDWVRYRIERHGLKPARGNSPDHRE